eukprot:6721962-Ditylum_brightwellii.AAC.1
MTTDAWKYLGKLGGGGYDNTGVTHHWVQQNFGDIFKEYYWTLQHPDNVKVSFFQYQKGFVVAQTSQMLQTKNKTEKYQN